MEEELKKKDKKVEKTELKDENNTKCNKEEKKVFKKDNKKELEIIELKKKNEELLNKVLYSQAEFANYKKRKELEVSIC